MKVGIVGGGILGLTLGYRLAGRGHAVEIFEAAPALGGLACTHDYGPFFWDRFYHCILPTDSNLIGLLRELGLSGDLRFTKTGTGYWARGRAYDMNGNLDYLRFPLLSLTDKMRLGAAVLYASRLADPWKLYQVSAQDWLTRVCGRRGYEIFWRPLLKAKFGPFYDRVAAVFIWATLTRLLGARAGGTKQETMGYVSGGYRRILGRFAEELARLGAIVRTGTNVVGVRKAGSGCELGFREDGSEGRAQLDQVFFTAPSRLARAIVDAELGPHVVKAERDYPTSGAYLGVACLVLVLRRPLTRYYVLNIGDESIELTGVIEMTNLIDRRTETGGLSLVYLPRYLDSSDPRLDASDQELAGTMMERGLLRLFGDLRADDFVYRRIHRTRYVQPLPLVRTGDARPAQFPTLERPFQILNTSMLTCATLNNNEVVGLVDKFVAQSAL